MRPESNSHSSASVAPVPLLFLRPNHSSCSDQFHVGFRICGLMPPRGEVLYFHFLLVVCIIMQLQQLTLFSANLYSQWVCYNKGERWQLRGFIYSSKKEDKCLPATSNKHISLHLEKMLRSQPRAHKTRKRQACSQ